MSSENMSASAKKALLIILDGWGIAKDKTRSAIDAANTPFFDHLMQTCPHAKLITHGTNVGLPEGQMGNSEVGHLNIGAGRIVYQDLAKINLAIDNDTLAENVALKRAMATAKEKNVSFHLLGLVSGGGVHSHINHLKALVTILKQNKLENSFIHAFTDGRDTAPDSGMAYMKDLSSFLEDKPTKLASIIGRYYAMDRDSRWERIKQAYDLLTNNKGSKSDDVLSYLAEAYANDTTDEFIEACSLNESPESRIRPGDVVLFYNFRSDRPRQLTYALTQGSLEEHEMTPIDLHFFTMTPYDSSFKNVHVLFDKDKLTDTLGELVSDSGLTQLRIAETEKYPHVTFFFSGGKEEAFPGEHRILINSPKVSTYDLQPEMSADGITKAIIKDIQNDPKDFICLNYANADMVGHTGVFEAAIKAVESLDSCLEELVPMAVASNYQVLIIADHGNSDIMKNEDGSVHTAHTLNLVPVILVGGPPKAKLQDGSLRDVAPTILDILKLKKPDTMTGLTLIT